MRGCGSGSRAEVARSKRGASVGSDFQLLQPGVTVMRRTFRDMVINLSMGHPGTGRADGRIGGGSARPGRSRPGGTDVTGYSSRVTRRGRSRRGGRDRGRYVRWGGGPSPGRPPGQREVRMPRCSPAPARQWEWQRGYAPLRVARRSATFMLARRSADVRVVAKAVASRSDQVVGSPTPSYSMASLHDPSRVTSAVLRGCLGALRVIRVASENRHSPVENL